MDANPFDDENGKFLVLVNSEEQFSLWPAFVPLPDGWSQVYAESSRQACLEFVEQSWTDLRPRSLRVAMDDPD
ncbi:MbtH family protein [Mycolicibacterium baixiangningiae]|uniref:MbtH family protein n=1 Tax=Mycolicibacterium baixiangningiae TaxID=2761578 RepID=UPI0018684224|nr:MbtH family protein [Mycolicibacterium baixiangningiae]